MRWKGKITGPRRHKELVCRTNKLEAARNRIIMAEKLIIDSRSLKYSKCTEKMKRTEAGRIDRCGTCLPGVELSQRSVNLCCFVQVPLGITCFVAES